jgi:ribosome-binding factor A
MKSISTRLSSLIGRQRLASRNQKPQTGTLFECCSSLSTSGFQQDANKSQLRSPRGAPDSTRFFTVSSGDLGPNPGLASVISQGASSLENNASEVEAKTKKALGDNKGDDPLQPRQLMEAQRILDVTTECLEEMAKGGTAGLLSVLGEPITIMEVQVNRDLKQAKVYWALPFSILLDDRIDGTVYRQLVTKMEKNILEKGGGRQVHGRLRFYYPPRMKFFPASNSMIHQAISDLVDAPG